MGSHPREFGYSPLERRHSVEISPFAIGKFEVTNEEFAAFLNSEGNQRDGGVTWIKVGGSSHTHIELTDAGYRPEPGYAKYPVVAVTWRGARAYCGWLTRRTGRRYFLPTEAQWEYAARAGTATAWPWGDRFDHGLLNSRAKPSAAGSRPNAAMPVGSYPPNPWGVHDLLGNVWEWTLDAYDPFFYWYSPLRNPVLWEEDSWAPVIRGGSFRNSLEFCRPGFRANYWWQGDYDNVGFRVCRYEN
jgi:formylglycine-generating enzyme required for sulfatase activity